MPAQWPQSQHKSSGVGCMCAQASSVVHRKRPASGLYSRAPSSSVSPAGLLPWHPLPLLLLRLCCA